MNEIFVKNLETNITRVVDALKSAVTGLEEKLPIADYTSIIDAISQIKLEKNDLSGIESSLSSIISALDVLKEKKIDTGKDDILKSLKDLISAVKQNKQEEVDMTQVTSLLSDIKLKIYDFAFPEQKEVIFPERYPLPEEQLEALKTKVDEEARMKLDKMIEVLKEIRVSVGGGGTDVVGLKNLDANGREQRINAATEETLQNIANSQYVSSNIDVEDETNYYFLSFIPGTTKWRINRLNKTTYVSDYATGDSSIATAWTNRTTQTYATIY